MFAIGALTVENLLPGPARELTSLMRDLEFTLPNAFTLRIDPFDPSRIYLHEPPPGVLCTAAALARVRHVWLTLAKRRGLGLPATPQRLASIDAQAREILHCDRLDGHFFRYSHADPWDYELRR